MKTVRAVSLAGATGTGKTAAALYLARHLNAEVVNFDSRQVYRDIPLITAQPSPEEQSVCPHHLYGYLDLDIPVQAGTFIAGVKEVLHGIAERGKLPLLVGGTGLYLKTLVEGIAPIPQIPPGVRRNIERACALEGSAVLHARLTAHDPEYAARIHPNDKQRVTRALEVFEATGKPLSWWHKQPGEKAPDVRVLMLGVHVDLQDLTPRLAKRIDTMLVSGGVQEMARAYALCPDRNAPAFTGIGCPELLGHLLDGVGIEETRATWLHNTRAYAKRQITWFKRIADMHWFAPDGFKEMNERVHAWTQSS
ncbi:tRNA (adenosine(37)-N6)-dimethylallyltransferase MiaA [Desulfoplanes sp.]